MTRRSSCVPSIATSLERCSGTPRSSRSERALSIARSLRAGAGSSLATIRLSGSMPMTPGEYFSLIGLYPFGAHVVVEGESEETLIGEVVLQVLGPRAARDVSVTNLKGVGGIGKAEQVMRALADYVGGSVLIMDAEGDVKRVVERLVRKGAIPEEDALVMKTSLEESYFSSEEMVATALRIAAEPNEKRPAAELRLTAAELDAEHEKRLDRAGRTSLGRPARSRA